MAPPFGIGDPVQTRLGKGIVRELRSGGHLVVEIAGRKVILEAASVSPVEPPRKAGGGKRPPSPPAFELAVPASGRDRAPAEVDLHGLFVADALARVEVAINDALLAGRLQLRLIHGRSGGRIKAAVHRQLGAMPSVRSFRIDPRNDGVTVVEF